MPAEKRLAHWQRIYYCARAAGLADNIIQGLGNEMIRVALWENKETTPQIRIASTGDMSVYRTGKTEEESGAGQSPFHCSS